MTLDHHGVATASTMAGHRIGAFRVRVTFQLLEFVTGVTGDRVLTAWILGQEGGGVFVMC